MEFGKYKPDQETARNSGVQYKFKFPNGYGASVVCSPYTYGGEAGLFELAVLDANGGLTYDTPVTDDVIGYLPAAEVETKLDAIAALTPESVIQSKIERERTLRGERIATLRAELAALESEERV